ncbi:hypothetical protein I4U23_005430 [Adineta vaga]|nr:hypothetical protein I4U23_005430 [Adineta vaga]
MSSISPEIRNYFKLELLLKRSSDSVRTLFKNRYFQFTGGQLWDDTSICGTNYFTNVIQKNKKINLTPVQKASIMNGNLDECNLSTLINLSLYNNRPTTLNPTETQQLDEENQFLAQLRDIQNKIAHCTSISYSDNEFNQLWTDLKKILVSFGDDDTEIDKLKEDSIFLSPTQEIRL